MFTGKNLKKNYLFYKLSFSHSYSTIKIKGWGVETITFVDNSKVSYSNPVRQSLFVFQDSISNSSKDNFKSLLAAENLKQIYPGVVSKFTLKFFNKPKL